MKCALSFLLTAILVGLAASDTPSLFPAPSFNPVNDAKTLHDAIAGFGTDEGKIISVLCHRVGAQRSIVAYNYLNKYGKSLIHDLDGDLSGSFGDICDSLTYTLTDYLAIELHRILGKTLSDALSVQEVLISRSKADIENIKTSYGNRYQKTLKHDIESTFYGSSNQLLSTLLDGARAEDNTPIDQNLVRRDVQDLYNAGQGMSGTNEAVFVNIFAARSYNHLNSVYSLYASSYGSTIESVIKSEFSLDIEDQLLDIVQRSKSKVTYFAYRLYQTLAGAGTKDHSLSRLIISRCETDLGDIKIKYQRLFGHSLADDVSGDSSGDFKKALLNLIG